MRAHTIADRPRATTITLRDERAPLAAVGANGAAGSVKGRFWVSRHPSQGDRKPCCWCAERRLLPKRAGSAANCSKRGQIFGRKIAIALIQPRPAKKWAAVSRGAKRATARCRHRFHKCGAARMAWEPADILRACGRWMRQSKPLAGGQRRNRCVVVTAGPLIAGNHKTSGHLAPLIQLTYRPVAGGW